jgi:hypothetical protein
VRSADNHNQMARFFPPVSDIFQVEALDRTSARRNLVLGRPTQTTEATPDVQHHEEGVETRVSRRTMDSLGQSRTIDATLPYFGSNPSCVEGVRNRELKDGFIVTFGSVAT